MNFHEISQEFSNENEMFIGSSICLVFSENAEFINSVTNSDVADTDGVEVCTELKINIFRNE